MEGGREPAAEEKQGQTLDIVTPEAPQVLPVHLQGLCTRLGTTQGGNHAWRGGSGPLLDEPLFDVDSSIVPAVGFEEALCGLRFKSTWIRISGPKPGWDWPIRVQATGFGLLPVNWPSSSFAASCCRSNGICCRGKKLTAHRLHVTTTFKSKCEKMKKNNL